MSGVSLYGTGIACGLILFSFLVKYVYGANLRYKYKKYDSGINNPGAKETKQILASRKVDAKIRSDVNYFKNSYLVTQKVLRMEQDCLTNYSVFEQVNAVFGAYKYMFILKRNNFVDKYKAFFTIANFLICFNLLWVLIVGWWWVALGLFLGSLLISIILVINYASIDNRAGKLTKEYLKLKVTPLAETYSYIKYKKLDTVNEILTIFFVPFISAFTAFNSWGRD